MQYWTIINNSHAGPFTVEELMAMNITPDTLLWHDGLTDWTPAGDIPALAVLFEHPEPNDASDTMEDVAEPACDSQAITSDPQEEEIETRDKEESSEPESQEAPLHAPTPPVFTQPVEPVFTPNNQYGGYNPYPPQQPQYVQAPQTEECPPTYLAWSIVVTLLCCLVVGVSAIICSSQVRSAWQRGDYRRARRMSEWAQWCIIFAIVGGLIWIPFQMAFSSLIPG